MNDMSGASGGPIIRRKRNMDKIRIGMLGAWRGNSYIDLMMRDEEIELVAVCDRHKETLNSVNLPESVDRYTDFDEFLNGGKKRGMNAVFLCNYFHQHAPFDEAVFTGDGAQGVELGSVAAVERRDGGQG